MADQNKISRMLEVLAENGFGRDDVKMLIRSINDEESTQNMEKPNEDDELEKRIKDILGEIPIPHIKGYEYLVTGIEIAYKYRKKGEEITYIEQKIANVYKTTSGSIHSALNVALEMGWKMLKGETARKYALYTISSERHRPPNKAFINAIVNYLIKEETEK